MAYKVYLPIITKGEIMARNRLPKGKGWFIWVITQTMKGDPQALAQAARNAGCSSEQHVDRNL